VVAIGPYNQPEQAFERMAEEHKSSISAEVLHDALEVVAARLDIKWADWSGEAALRQIKRPVLPAEEYLFQNRRGEPLTRFGVRYLLRKYLPKRFTDGQTGLRKRLHPHSLRHYADLRTMPSGSWLERRIRRLAKPISCPELSFHSA